MAKPPTPSVVLRTAKPTNAQAVQAARAQQAKFASGLPNPLALPNLTNVAPNGATVGSASRPVPVNRRGLVPNPDGAVGALTAGASRNQAPARPAVKPAAPKPHVTLTLHPNGKVEIAHTPAPTNTATPKLAGEGTTDPVTGRTTIGATRVSPTVKPPARLPAATGPAAPQQTIEQQAQSILDPVKQSILDAINQRVTAQQSAITNYAKDLAGMMGQYGPAAGAAYGNAETGQSAIDAALAQTLQGAGASGQADLAAKLAQINADPGTAARVNGAAAQTTQGALGAQAARGASSLSQLVGQKANAQDYGAKLPGLAGLYGLQATKSAQSQGTTDTANAVAQLEQKLPDVIQQLKTNGTQQQQIRFERGAALLSANGGVVTPQIKALLGGALPVGKTAKAKAIDAASAPKVDTSLSKTLGFLVDNHGDAVLKGGKIVELPKTATSKAQKANASLSKSLGYVVDASGHPILNAGQKIMLPKTAAKVTATTTRDNAKALGLARIGHTSTTVGGVEHPAVSWQQYLSTGLSQGIPASVLIEQGKKVYSQREIKLGLIPGVNGG